METMVDKLATLSDCLVVFEFFGLQNFSLRKALRKHFIEQTSIFRKLYFSIWLSCLIILGCISSISVSTSEQVTFRNVLTLMYSQVTTYIFNIAIWMSLVQSFISTRHIKQLWKNTFEIAEYFNHEFGAVMRFNDLKKSIHKLYAAETLVFVAVHLVISSFKYMNVELFFGQATITILYTSSFVIVVNKFLFYVSLINFQLDFVQKLILSAGKHQQETLDKKICFLSASDFPLRTVKKSKYQSFWRTYNKILENGMLVNNSFGYTNLLILVNIITTSTFCGYILCAKAMGESRKDFAG